MRGSSRRRVARVEEVTFDPVARAEYLTGFHKRKKERIRNAQEAAARREREERIRHRREIREQRKQELQQHMDKINEELRKASDYANLRNGGPDAEIGLGSDASDSLGYADSSGIDEEADYFGEDGGTTVTVKAMDVSGTSPPLAAESASALDSSQYPQDRESSSASGYAALTRQRGVPEKPSLMTGKTKRKKFRYESKAERKITRFKEGARKTTRINARRL